MGVCSRRDQHVCLDWTTVKVQLHGSTTTVSMETQVCGIRTRSSIMACWTPIVLLLEPNDDWLLSCHVQCSCPQPCPGYKSISKYQSKTKIHPYLFPLDHWVNTTWQWPQKVLLADSIENYQDSVTRVYWFQIIQQATRRLSTLSADLDSCEKEVEPP